MRGSGILDVVRFRFVALIYIFLAASALGFPAFSHAPSAAQPAAALLRHSPEPPSSFQASPPQGAPAETPAPPPASAPQEGAASALTPPQQLPAPRGALNVVVLDAAHGGVDQGAHGSSGISESDVVLSFARIMRISLEAQGFRVLMTRQANEDRSFDDRSKIANAQRGAIFISLHVSSVGTPGTVRVYSLPQETSAATPAYTRSELVPWDRAQQRFTETSHRLGELIQIQMAQRFRGSPETPSTALVRQLRTIAAPAVAVEVSSVSVADRKPLDQMAQGLADGLARGVAGYRLVYDAGGK